MSALSVQNYINSLDENGKKYVSEFAAFMENEFPDFMPQICYAMPMWRLGAKMYDGYVAVSAAKNHYSIHFLDDKYISKLKDLLPGCKFGKKCINIDYNDETAFFFVKQCVMDYLKANQLMKFKR